MIEDRGKNLPTSRIPLHDHVVTCQLILLPQMVITDLLRVSQPTISRILSHGYHRRPKELPGIIHLVTNLEILRTYTHNQPHE